MAARFAAIAIVAIDSMHFVVDAVRLRSIARARWVGDYRRAERRAQRNRSR